MSTTSARSVWDKIDNEFGTLYEIKCDETFAFYDGYVVDYDETKCSIKTSFGWKKQRWLHTSWIWDYIKSVAPSPDPKWMPKQNERVEVQSEV